MNVLLTCSAGGHLTEMRQLENFYRDIPHFFVTFYRGDTQSLAKSEKVYFIERPARNPLKTIKAFFQAWNIIMREKPALVISTGADVTVPVCLAAKLNGIPFVFSESFCRVTSPGITGKILSPIADYVFFQWKELEKFYPSGIYAGSIFGSGKK